MEDFNKIVAKDMDLLQYRKVRGPPRQDHHGRVQVRHAERGRHRPEVRRTGLNSKKTITRTKTYLPPIPRRVGKFFLKYDKIEATYTH